MNKSEADDFVGSGVTNNGASNVGTNEPLKPTYLYYINSARLLTSPRATAISLPFLKAPMPERLLHPFSMIYALSRTPRDEV